ncbi:MAG: hypothetical protein QGG87_05990, partial [Nitrospinota bacterium]|nr:hypothetical protein [Nitrospinota bacterium]
EKTETAKPVPTKETEEATMTEPVPAKESTPKESTPKKSTAVEKGPIAKEEKDVKKRKTKQSIIPGATLPVSKGRIRSINIGSIMPVLYSRDETKVISLSIKMAIDNRQVYDQVRDGFPYFEDKVEETIEKYFAEKFYKDVKFVQEKLRKEIYSKLNEELKGGKIKSIELEDFLIQ